MPQRLSEFCQSVKIFAKYCHTAKHTHIIWSILVYTCIRFRSNNSRYEETNFTRSECGGVGGVQKTVLTDFREFSTESETYRAKIQLDSFKLKKAKFRTSKNNNLRTWEEFDKIEVCPNNLINLVRTSEDLTVSGSLH